MAYNENSPGICEKLLAKHFPVVRRFNELPDDALVAPGVIACIEHCSMPTFYRRVDAGLLPSPVRIGGSSRVNVGDYRRVRAARKAEAERHPESYCRIGRRKV
jgi:predicted DNA-binding transcriptional regulator AlpA